MAQVPMLNFASMPLVTPRSEIEGFSNALLNAGSMRQQRLDKAEAARRAEEQRRFENEMATKQFGLQEKADVRADRSAALDEKRFGLQERQFATAEQEAQERIAQSKITTQEMKQQQAFEQYLQQPDVQATMKTFKDKGDQMGLLNFLEQSATAVGANVPNSMLEVSQARLAILQEDRNKAKDAAQLRLIDAQIGTEGLQQAKYRAEAAAAANKPVNVEFLQKQRDYIFKQQENTEQMISSLQKQIHALDILTTKVPTEENIAQLEEAAGQGSPEFQLIAKFRQEMSGKNPKEKQILLQQLGARLNPVLTERKNQLAQWEQTRNKNIELQNAYSTLIDGSSIPMPPSFGTPAPATNAPAPQTGGPVIDMLGGLVGEVKRQLRIGDYNNRQQTGWFDNGQTTMDRFSNAFKKAQSQPLTTPEKPTRPSKATTAFTTGYNL